MPRFIWYELMTADPLSAMRFYPGVTGWRAERYEQSPTPYWVWLNGEAPLGGLMPMPDAAEQGGAPPYWMPYVACDDVDTTVKAAHALGARVYVPPTEIHDNGRFAVLADPQGALFSVFSPTAPVAPCDGAQLGCVVWHELVTSDAGAAMEFYGTLFGWKRTRALDLGSGGVYQMYGDNGESYGGIYARSRNSAMAPHWLLYVRVRDLDRAVSCVVQLGGAVLQVREVPDGSQVAECLDAQGARFALSAR